MARTHSAHHTSRQPTGLERSGLEEPAGYAALVVVARALLLREELSDLVVGPDRCGKDVVVCDI